MKTVHSSGFRNLGWSTLTTRTLIIVFCWMLSGCALKMGYQSPLDGAVLTQPIGFKMVEGEVDLFPSRPVEVGLGFSNSWLQQSPARTLTDFRAIVKVVPVRRLVTPYVGGGYVFSFVNQATSTVTDNCTLLGPNGTRSCVVIPGSRNLGRGFSPVFLVGSRFGCGKPTLVVEYRIEFDKKLGNFNFSNKTILVGVRFYRSFN